MDPVAGRRGTAEEGAVGFGLPSWNGGGPVGWRRGGEAELLRLGGSETDPGGLDAGVAGELGGADPENLAGVEGLGDGAGDADDDFELAGAVGDALLERAVEGLQLAGHGFELGGEVFDLVARASRSGDGSEVARGDAPGGQGEVAQAARGADGGEPDEGGREQGRAEEGNEDEGAGAAEGFERRPSRSVRRSDASRWLPGGRSR